MNWARTGIMFDLKNIDKNWTLFLDRDGVINHEKDDDYINTWKEFVFYEGVGEAIQLFSKKFGIIIIVTNQRGVGRGVTKKEELENIHQQMIGEIGKSGGRIDALYFCTDIDDSSPDRKPNPGMGLRAQLDFPGIDLNRSVMVGNNLSDMIFGRNLGAHTVFLTTTHPDFDRNEKRIDVVYDSLLSFAHALSAFHP